MGQRRGRGCGGKAARNTLDTSQTARSTREINKVSTTSSFFFFFSPTPLPLESFRSTFSTLINAGSAHSSAGFDVRYREFFAWQLRGLPVRVSRDGRRKTGTLDEHGSAKIAKMTLASGAGGCQSGIYLSG